MRSSDFTFFKQAPFLRLLPGFITGILIQYYFPHKIILESGLITTFIFYTILLRYRSIQQIYRLSFITGLYIYIAFISLGSVITRFSNVQHYDNWIGHHADKHQAFLIRLLETPVERKKSLKTTAIVERCLTKGEWQASEGKVLLYFSKEEKNKVLKSGDYLLLQKPLQLIDDPENPGAFNYAAYLARKNIYHRLFLKANDYRLVDSGRKSITRYTVHLILSALRKHIPGKQEQAIAEALLIGYTFDLEDDLVDAYSKTGVIHVIAISGMHLGLVYGILLWLTSFFKRIKLLQWIRPVLILLVLWAFSILVGAGASILRAAVIFSFMLIAEWLQRKHNPYNSLAASMFCLLCFNPFYLWDIGFQLSYTAVAGIIVFAKPFYHYWYISYTPIRYCWQLVIVTCSAQVFTIPVVLYHFHQFPNLFLITNLIVVPLSGVVLYGLILLLILSPFHWVASVLGIVLDKTLAFMNQLILYTGQLPFAVTSHIQINAVQIIGYFLFVLYICRWIIHKKSVFLLYAFVCLATLVALYAYRHIQIRQKKQLIVYHLPGQPVTEILGGGKYISIANPENLSATLKMRLPTHTLLGGFRKKTALPSQKNRLLSVNGLNIAFVHQKPLLRNGYSEIETDIVIVQNNPAVTVADLQRVFKARLYVWDANNPLWKIRKWKKEADSLHLRHHSIPEQGAFVMDF